MTGETGTGAGRPDVRLRAKVWLETGEGKVFGDGPSDILARVGRLGSLRQAASEIGMSYAHAWKLIKGLESRLGFPLLKAAAGGVRGGTSVLTPEAEDWLEAYKAFREECQEAIIASFRRHFERLVGDWEITAPGRRAGPLAGDSASS